MRFPAVSQLPDLQEHYMKLTTQARPSFMAGNLAFHPYMHPITPKTRRSWPVALRTGSISPSVSVMMDNLMVAAGGPAGWDTLPVEKKKVLGDEALRRLRINVGEIAFGQLSDAEKNGVDFFVWGIRAWWGQNAIEGPVLLMNKDNTAAAAATSDNSKVKDRAVNVSAGGAQKVLDLAGAIWLQSPVAGYQQHPLPQPWGCRLRIPCPRAIVRCIPRTNPFEEG